jgi:hypothetical protein
LGLLAAVGIVAVNSDVKHTMHGMGVHDMVVHDVGMHDMACMMWPCMTGSCMMWGMAGMAVPSMDIH